MRDFINNDLGKPPRVTSFITSIRVLWGGVGIHVGTFIFWLGMVIVFQQVSNSEFKHIGATWVESKGTLMKYREGEIELDDYKMLYEYIIGYQVDGESYLTISYAKEISPFQISGLSKVNYEPNAFAKNTDIAVEVLIEYKKSDPTVARIKKGGMFRAEPYSLATGFLLIIPLIGFLIMLLYYIKNKKIYNLLKKGIATRGRLVDSNATNVTVNEQQVYKYDFEFVANSKKYKVSGNTHHYSRVENEEKELILYNKANPNKAIIYDIYSYLPSIGVDGVIIQSSFVGIVPIVIIHSVGFLITYIF